MKLSFLSPLAAITLGLLIASCTRSARQTARAPGVYPRVVTSKEAQARAAASLHPLLDDAAIPWTSNATMRALSFVRQTALNSTYSHKTTVDLVGRQYRFDCSGMAALVLERAAPAASATLRMNRLERPLAVDFYRTISNAPAVGESGGWARVPSVFEAQPGDIIAWLPHEQRNGGNTGHVAFLVHRPTPLPGYHDAYLVRIADSTSSYHAYDTREPPHSTGFGFGTILLVVDERDTPVGYAWAATRSPRVRTTNIAIGRATR